MPSGSMPSIFEIQSGMIFSRKIVSHLSTLSVVLIIAILAFSACIRRRVLVRTIGASSLHASHISDYAVTAPPVMKRGIVRKEGGNIVKSYNDRYFVLQSTETASTLVYYMEKAADENPPYGSKERGRMNLLGAEVCPALGHVDIVPKNGEAYRLDGRETVDITGWIQALKEHIEFANRNITTLASEL
jgi:hypothetical protein